MEDLRRKGAVGSDRLAPEDAPLQDSCIDEWPCPHCQGPELGGRRLGRLTAFARTTEGSVLFWLRGEILLTALCVDPRRSELAEQDLCAWLEREEPVSLEIAGPCAKAGCWFGVLCRKSGPAKKVAFFQRPELLVGEGARSLSGLPAGSE